MWRAVSGLPDRGARVELTSLLLLVHFMFGFLAKLWPNIRPYLGLLKYLIVSLDRSPILLRVISWLQSCKLMLQVDTFHSKQPIDFLSVNWMQTRRVCMTNDCWQYLSPVTPPDPPQQCDSLFSGPHHGNQKTNHQCKHQAPLSSWQISPWD